MYRDQFGLDMANEFVSYVETKLPPLRFRREPCRLAIHIIAHSVRLAAITYRKDSEDMRRSATFILSTMSKIKQVDHHPPILLLEAEANAQYSLWPYRNLNH